MDNYKIIINILVILFFSSSVFTKDLRLTLNDTCFHKLSNKKGVCILLQDCPAAIAILHNGLPQTCDFKTLNGAAHPIVCCPEDGENNEITDKNKNENISIKKCEEYSSITAVFNEKDSVNIDFEDKIVGGENASVGEFPHMAALGYGPFENIKWLCGGTLISEYFVVTAGHCVFSQSNGNVSYVELGTIILYRESRQKLGDRFIYTVTNIYMHDQYRPPSTYNDISLLKLDRKVEFSLNIKPACLHTEPTFGNIKSFEATGWGLTKFQGDPTDFLQKVKLELFDHATCNEKYRNLSERKLRDGIIDSQLCAGSKTTNSDTCPGDSGGPLHYLNFKYYLFSLAGITSFGRTCGTPNQPGVYTKVSAFVPWIESIVWNDKSNV